MGRGAYSYNVNTGLRQQLERDFGVLPTAFDEVEWMVGSDLMWSPLYGKMALLNQSVIALRELFLLGGTRCCNEPGSSTGTTAGLTSGFRPAVNLGLRRARLHHPLVSFRLDVTDNVVVAGDRIFNVPTLQLSGALNFGATE